ncbi:2-arachidonoylglycerol hydrolase ABHD12 [Aphelenchoides fujianensis]|nr:2-arachidonoylglycerol hydrolase ABHD12 [Aphelenchoides fujianensis]
MRTFVRSLVMGFVPLPVVYFLLPLLIYSFPYFFQHIFFLNFVKIPFTDYQNLSAYGVGGGFNFYLRFNTTVGGKPEAMQLGAWHVFPQSFAGRFPPNADFSTDEIKKIVRRSDSPIVVYLHGNSFDRTTRHRCELYRILSALDYHVLAIDYRGYGDSWGRPTEIGVVEDAKAIFKYARELDPEKPVFFWSHSLGTAVAARTVAELSVDGTPPNALVLEAPFNNLPEVISNHPFSVPFRFLPWFNSTVIEPLIASGLRFASDEHVAKISCPMLVFHAQDDHIIPVKLGRKLVDAARAAGRRVEYVEFEARRQFLHKYMHRAEELPTIVKEFFAKSQ